MDSGCTCFPNDLDKGIDVVSAWSYVFIEETNVIILDFLVEDRMDDVGKVTERYVTQSTP
jgi:hypothetical protein